MDANAVAGQVPDRRGTDEVSVILGIPQTKGSSVGDPSGIPREPMVPEVGHIRSRL